MPVILNKFIFATAVLGIFVTTSHALAGADYAREKRWLMKSRQLSSLASDLPHSEEQTQIPRYSDRCRRRQSRGSRGAWHGHSSGLGHGQHAA